MTSGPRGPDRRRRRRRGGAGGRRRFKLGGGIRAWGCGSPCARCAGPREARCRRRAPRRRAVQVAVPTGTVPRHPSPSRHEAGLRGPTWTHASGRIRAAFPAPDHPDGSCSATATTRMPPAALRLVAVLEVRAVLWPVGGRTPPAGRVRLPVSVAACTEGCAWASPRP